MSDDLIIELEQPDRARRPGEVVRGTVHVRPGAGETSRGLHVRRCWKTHGRGNRDTGDAQELTLHEGPIPDGGPGTFPFEFDVPARPVTYRGRLLNVDHYVEAWLDLPMALDAKTEVEFGVVPGEDAAPPPADLLERSEKAGKVGVSGCGALVGIAMLFIGFALLPFGLILIAVAAVLIIPPVRRTLAEKKLGRITATLHPEVVAPGGEVAVRVAVEPDRDRSVNQVHAIVRCREICVSGRGTDRTTHREELESLPLTLQGPSSLRMGQRTTFEGTFQVPADAGHTFVSSNNNVVWDVEVHVDIPSWPDWRERVPLVVWPIGAPLVEGRKAPQAPAPAPTATSPAAPVDVPAGPPVESAAPAAAAPSDRPIPPSGSPPSSPPSPPASSTSHDPDPLPPDASELARRIAAILAEPRFGGRRDDLIEELVGVDYELMLVLERNERSFGVPADYRDGRTLRGTVDGTDFVVEVRFPPGRNDELADLGRGDRVPVRARAVQWESLRSQPLLEA